MYCAHEAHVYRQENAKKKYPNLKLKVKNFFFGLRMLGRSDG